MHAAKKGGGGGKKGGSGGKKGPGSLMHPPKPAEPYLQTSVIMQVLHMCACVGRGGGGQAGAIACSGEASAAACLGVTTERTTERLCREVLRRRPPGAATGGHLRGRR